MSGIGTQDTPQPARGSGVLSSGTVTVNNTNALSTSTILINDTNTTITNVGALRVSSKSNGSFVVSSTNVLDSSTFDYVIFN
jgi:hypothetical protein